MEEIAFSQETTDVVEELLYLPAVRLMDKVGNLARAVQNGSIHRYIGFSFAALVLVLLAVTH